MNGHNRSTVDHRRGWWWLLLLGVLELRLSAEVCEPIRTFADGRQPTREIFVSPTGNNTTGTGSRTAPFRTLSRAVQGVKPGEAIRLLAGTHAGGSTLSGLAGASNAPIWIGGVPGEARPVIQGGASGLQLSRVRHLVIENLEITGATANGINCDDGGDYSNPEATRFLIFRNLFIHDIGTGGNHDGLKLSGVYDLWVLGCEFLRMSAGGSGVDQVGCHRGLIADCTFTEMGSNAIQCKGGTADMEIRANRFFNGGGRAINVGGSTGFQFFRPPLSTSQPNAEARDIRVFANVFQGSDAPIAFVGAVDSVAAHNTIIQPQRWIMRILQETVSGGGFAFRPSGDNRFVNNLIYFERARVTTPVNVGGNTDPASFEFNNNLWFAFDRSTQSRPTLPALETGGVYGQNPMLRDVEGGDFSVPPSSPAAGRGLPLSQPKSDQGGHCWAAHPTIGAWEAAPPPPPPQDADADGMPDEWESIHQLDPGNPLDAHLDLDRDGLSNLGEFLAGTDPRAAGSRFVLEEVRQEGGALSFRYATLPSRIYRVEAADSLDSNGWSELAATEGTGESVDFSEELQGPGRLFRVRIEKSD